MTRAQRRAHAIVWSVLAVLLTVFLAHALHRRAVRPIDSSSVLAGGAR